MDFFRQHRKAIMIIVSLSFLAWMFIPVLLPLLMQG